MKLLFLRGQLPVDRPHSQIMFNNLNDCDDMWIQLAYKLVQYSGGYGEVWYEKGQRVVHYAENFKERWVPRYATTIATFTPDIVFARGGFWYMWPKAESFLSAYKIYYGAGMRVVPKPGGPWHLVLVDTPKQLRGTLERKYNAKLWAKPAAENIFKPLKKNIKYDFIYVANWNPYADKGYRFLLPELNKYRTLHVGINREGWKRKFPNIVFTGWVPRKKIPEFYAQAKVAVISTRGKDSCPRVIPEALACNTPILVGNTTKIWGDKYITSSTGRLFDKSNFHVIAQQMLKEYKKYQPFEYYSKELSLENAAKFILNCWKQYKVRTNG